MLLTDEEIAFAAEQRTWAQSPEGRAKLEARLAELRKERAELWREYQACCSALCSMHGEMALYCAEQDEYRLLDELGAADEEIQALQDLLGLKH